MSTCISRHGEYSSHEPDQDCICTLCGAVDYDALIAERDAAVARADAAEATIQRVRALHGHESFIGYCTSCGYAPPCPTVRALDGGETA